MQSERASIDELADSCEQAQALFRRGLASDPQYCFELFMRATEENGENAFTHIYRIYRNQVENWIRHHPRFDTADETAEWYVNATFGNFYHHLRKPSFRDRSESLGGVLKFLKMCAHSVIVESARRDRSPGPSEELDEETYGLPTDFSIDEDLILAQFWECIRSAIADENLQFLAFLTFGLDMPPREIEAEYPDRWPDARKHVYRLRQKLREDAEFHRCIGF